MTNASDWIRLDFWLGIAVVCAALNEYWAVITAVIVAGVVVVQSQFEFEPTKPGKLGKGG